VFLPMALLVFAGCFVPPPNEKESLRDQVRSYHDALRWRRFAEAATFLPPDRRGRFLERVDGIKDDIEVSDYEVQSTAPSAATGTIEVRIAIEWQSKRTGLLRKTELRESWRRVKDGWLLAESRHASGDHLPVLEE
jgi:hypothetical protein